MKPARMPIKLNKTCTNVRIVMPKIMQASFATRFFRDCRGTATIHGSPAARNQLTLCGNGVVVFRLDFELAFGLLCHQVRAHEGIEIAVEDAVDIAYDELGAMVLDLAVRLHDVRANLAAE